MAYGSGFFGAFLSGLQDVVAGDIWMFITLGLFGNTKAELHEIRRKSIHFLKTLRLCIHEGRAQPTPVSQGVTFLGFRLFPAYKRLKREKLVNGYRKLLKNQKLLESGELTRESYQHRLRGWLNHVRFGNTWHLRNEVLTRLGVNAWQSG